MAAFSLGLDVAEEVNRYFLEKDYGDPGRDERTSHDALLPTILSLLVRHVTIFSAWTLSE